MDESWNNLLEDLRNFFSNYLRLRSSPGNFNCKYNSPLKFGANSKIEVGGQAAKVNSLKYFITITHQADSIGLLSVKTRDMYSTQVMSLNNKLAIRIRKPVDESGGGKNQ